MSISFLIMFLGILGSSLSAILLFDSIFRVVKSLKSLSNEESELQEEEVIVSLIAKDKNGNILNTQQANVSESKAKELSRSMKSFSH